MESPTDKKVEEFKSPKPSIKTSFDSPVSPTNGFTKLEITICQHRQSVMIDHSKNLHYGCRKCFSVEILLNAMLNRKTKSFVDLIRRYKQVADLPDPRGQLLLVGHMPHELDKRSITWRCL